MYLKIHETRGERIVAICDESLIGKVLQEGKVVLDLNTYKNFYIGEKANEKEVETALTNFSSANIVGKESVALAVKLKLVSEDNIVYIKGIPHIQIYRL